MSSQQKEDQHACRVTRKKVHARKMLGTSRIAVFFHVFSMIRGSCCSKSSLAKAAGAEVAAEQSYEKWHAAVARSTFVRENVQNTAASEPFWKL